MRYHFSGVAGAGMNPLAPACRIAIDTVRAATVDGKPAEVLFCAFDEATAVAYRAALA